ncbi:hypothetical protein HAX54_017562, partial [Datura stramonium]|nr:hypothetical protein [Datura stramonium]
TDTSTENSHVQELFQGPAIKQELVQSSVVEYHQVESQTNVGTAIPSIVTIEDQRRSGRDR